MWGSISDFVNGLSGKQTCPEGYHWVDQSMVDGPKGCFINQAANTSVQEYTISQGKKIPSNQMFSTKEFKNPPIITAAKPLNVPTAPIREEMRYLGFTRNQILFIGGSAAALYILAKNRSSP